MRTIFTLVLVLHGLIHLMGFLKGFGWYQPKELSLPISKTWGLLWLLSSVLLLGYAFAFSQLENEWANKIGLAALVISQIVLLNFWIDARYGTLVNILLLVVLLFNYAHDRFVHTVRMEQSDLLSENLKTAPQILNSENTKHLPIPVQKWLEQSGSIGKPIPAYTSFQQSMRMKIKPEQKQWYSAKAEQLSTSQPPGFIWKVNVDILPLISMTGRDKFVDGKGEMLIKFNSLFNIVNASGEKIDEGALQRYLGEIAWTPAYALSPYIQWENIDDHSARAILNYGGTTGSGIFHFNTDGHFAKFTAWRYNGNEENAKRYNWIMTALEYDTFEGITIPSKLKATWILEEGEWNWLELRVEEVRYEQKT